MEGGPEHLLLRCHQLVGLATIFIVTPGALVTTKGGPVHRAFGQAFVVGMLALYVTGTYFTLTSDDLFHYKIARTLLFNLMGILFVVLGYGAIRMPRGGGRIHPRRVDWALLVLLGLVSVAMLPVGFKRWYMFVFAAVGIAFCWLDYRAFTGRAKPAPTAMSRHLRYMFASFFYALTIMSILVLPPGGVRAKWVWPTVVGLPILLLVSSDRSRRRLGARRNRVLMACITLMLALSYGFGALVVRKLLEELAS